MALKPDIWFGCVKCDTQQVNIIKQEPKCPRCKSEMIVITCPPLIPLKNAFNWNTHHNNDSSGIHLEQKSKEDAYKLVNKF